MFEKECWPKGKSIRSQIGYLPGDVHMYSHMRASKYLDFLQRARRIDCRAEIKRLAAHFELGLDKSIRKFSSGMRQKLGLIQAMMHQPQLLVLDEPTSALDPLVRKSVFAELKQVTEQGRSVLFSSHSLGEVEELCDEVVILRQGRIVEHRQIQDLKEKALRRVNIVFATGHPVPQQIIEGFKVVEQNHHNWSGTWTGEMRSLLNWLSDYQVEDVIIERPDLNDLFITYYQDQLA